MDFLILFTASNFLALSVIFALGKVFQWGMQSCFSAAAQQTHVHVFMCIYVCLCVHKYTSAELFPLESSDRTREDVQNSSGRFTVGIREHFFAERVDKPWVRLPRKVVDTPGLLVFKKDLEKALNRL